MNQPITIKNLRQIQTVDFLIAYIFFFFFFTVDGTVFIIEVFSAKIKNANNPQPKYPRARVAREMKKAGTK